MNHIPCLVAFEVTQWLMIQDLSPSTKMAKKKILKNTRWKETNWRNHNMRQKVIPYLTCLLSDYDSGTCGLTMFFFYTLHLSGEQKAPHANSRWRNFSHHVGLCGGFIKIRCGLCGSLSWRSGASLRWLHVGHQPLRLRLLRWAGPAQTQDTVFHLQRAPRLGPTHQNWQGVWLHWSISGSPLWKEEGSKG